VDKHNNFTSKQNNNFTCISTGNTTKGLVILDKMTSLKKHWNMNKPVFPTHSIDQRNIKHDLKYYSADWEREKGLFFTPAFWNKLSKPTCTNYLLHKKLPNTNNLNIPAFPLKIFITSISCCPSRQRSQASMQNTNLHQHAENNNGVRLHK